MTQETWSEAKIEGFVRTYADSEYSDEGACRQFLEEVPNTLRPQVLARIDATLHTLKLEAHRKGPSAADSSPNEAVHELQLKMDWARGVLGVRPD